jgi:hypothetical protein
MRERYKTYLAVAAIILALFLASRVQELGMLTPGPEGVRCVAYGVEFPPSTTIFKASSADKLPAGYEWVSNQPSILSIRHAKGSGEPFGGIALNGPDWWYKYDSGTFRVEVQRPTLQDDPLGLSTRQITYYKYVKLSDTQIEIHKVVATLVSVDFVLQISVVPGEGLYTWKYTKVWLALDTVSWMNAYSKEPPPDPNPLTNDTVKYVSSNYRGAFPIIAWFSEYKDWVWTKSDGSYSSQAPDGTATGFCQIDPSLEGRYIDLYTSPGTKYDLMLQADAVQNPDLIASMLKPDALPDPRFAETVYFVIQLVKFGAYVKPTGIFGSYSSYDVYYPSVFARVRVVYAVYGEYVYLWTTQTASQAGYTETTWEVRGSTQEEHLDPLTAFFRGIANWFANPWNILGLGVFGLLAIVLIAIILLFWFFGFPRREK